MFAIAVKAKQTNTHIVVKISSQRTSMERENFIHGVFHVMPNVYFYRNRTQRDLKLNSLSRRTSVQPSFFDFSEFLVREKITVPSSGEHLTMSGSLSSALLSPERFLRGTRTDGEKKNSCQTKSAVFNVGGYTRSNANNFEINCQLKAKTNILCCTKTSDPMPSTNRFNSLQL